jgi:hypothetical protein
MAGFARESWLALASGGGLLVAVLFDEMLFDQAVGFWLLQQAASYRSPKVSLAPKSVTTRYLLVSVRVTHTIVPSH